jgi:membrane-bound lytic murein transglycosylase MltF
MIGLLVAALLTTPAMARTMSDIRASGELRACVAYVSPYQGKVEPPGCRDNCTATGDTADLVAAFAHALGGNIKAKVISIGWDEQFADANGNVDRNASYTPRLLADGTCDLYATNLTRLPWRSTKMAMVTVNPSRNMIVVRSERRNDFRSAADLAGKVAATYKDTSYHTWLDEQNRTTYRDNPIKIVFVEDEPAALRSLEEGRADFTILVADDVVPEIRNAPAHFALPLPAGPVIEMSWALRLDDHELQAAAEEFLQAQRADKASLLNQQFSRLYGMDVSDFSEMVGAIK